MNGLRVTLYSIRLGLAIRAAGPYLTRDDWAAIARLDDVEATEHCRRVLADAVAAEQATEAYADQAWLDMFYLTV